MSAQAPRYRSARLEAFSDGVFAIAITLLVLDIAVPRDATEGDLLGALVDQWPAYLAYLVSFATIGAVWFKHTVVTEYVEHSTAALHRLNLLLLFVVALLPFPTSLLAESIGVSEAERVATTVYGINLLLTSVLVSALWRYAVRERLVRPDVPDDEVRSLTTRLTPSLAGYAVMIVVGLFLPIVAVVGYLVIAVIIILPLGALRRRRSHA